MPHYKIIISVIAVMLTFVGYIPYIRDIFKKKTKPHAFTWFIWFLACSTTYALQVLGGAGVGSWVTLIVSIICFFIFILSLKFGSKDITRSDVLFFILAIVSLILWLVVKQPVWSVILIVATDVIGFVPTVRKSWNNPYSETLSTYSISTFRHGLSIFALEKINILTILYPIAWTIANGLFTLMLIMRRKRVTK